MVVILSLPEGRGFNPAGKALTHHFVVPPLPLAERGKGVRAAPVAAGFIPALPNS